jgi:hypothetical protein
MKEVLTMEETLNFGLSEADRENILTGYNGENPPANVLLPGVLSRMFLTKDKGGHYLLKVLYKVVGGEYDGFPAWDNVSLKPDAAFKWAPLCDDVLHIELAAFNSGMKIDKENKSSVGYPVLGIGETNYDDLPVMFSVGYRDYKAEDGTQSKQTEVRMAFSDGE